MFSEPIDPDNFVELDEDKFDKILKGIRLNNVRSCIQVELLREQLVEKERAFSRKLIDSENETLELVQNITTICEEWKREGKTTSRVIGTCVICLDANPSYIARPCNHLILCRNCYDSVTLSDLGTKCPKCKREMSHCELVYT